MTATVCVQPARRADSPMRSSICWTCRTCRRAKRSAAAPRSRWSCATSARPTSTPRRSATWWTSAAGGIRGRDLLPGARGARLAGASPSAAMRPRAITSRCCASAVVALIQDRPGRFHYVSSSAGPTAGSSSTIPLVLPFASSMRSHLPTRGRSPDTGPSSPRLRPSDVPAVAELATPDSTRRGSAAACS